VADGVEIDWSQMSVITKALQDASAEAIRSSSDLLRAAATGVHDSWAQYAPRVSGQAAEAFGTSDVYAKGDGVAIQVGPTAPYARRLELGFRRQSGRGRQATPPFHFVRDGLYAYGPELGNLIRTTWNPARLKGGRYG
jgi:hypothetical protein